MTRTILIMAVALGMSVSGLDAQETARDRAQRALPPEVFRELTSLADELGQAGVPADPLYSKALEGAAKRVPPPMLLPAVLAPRNGTSTRR